MTALEIGVRPGRKPLSLQPFKLYAVIVAALAAGLVGAEIATTSSAVVPSEAKFWLFATFVLLGEMLSIQIPRRDSSDCITVSAAFAVALLLAYGPVPAMLVYAAASVLADARVRVSPLKILFNGAQYVLSVGVAAGILALTTGAAPVESVPQELGGILLASIGFFLVNHVLTGVAIALATGASILGYLRDDFVFQAWTAGFLLALAPIVEVAAEAGAWLIPVTFVPMLAIFFGGRQAAINIHRASHDALTDLPNRWMLESRLTAALADGGPTGVLMADLDHFTSVNETLGHVWGDELLKQVGGRLERAVGSAGLLARSGGDEFAVLVEGREEECVALARRMAAVLEAPFEVSTLSLEVSLTTGIAWAPADGQRAAELLQHADTALRHAKRDQVPLKVYDEAADDFTIDRLVLAGQLRRAIDRGELFLDYQPKFSLQGSDTHGVEALVRWNHPQLGRLSPDGFIPIAEQTGVIKPLTLHIMDLALAQCRAWRDAGMDLRIAVNVSPSSLIDRDFPEAIGALLDRHHLPSDALQLEITEARLIVDRLRTKAVLDELRVMGLAIAIDDFGTGYSSLTQLQELPVDEIKIDKSFVLRMETNRNDAAIVRSTIDLGHNLGLAVTAEGVESESVTQQLVHLGCHFAQGFHLGRPVDADACARLIADYVKGAACKPVVGLSRTGADVLRLGGSQ